MAITVTMKPEQSASIAIIWHGLNQALSCITVRCAVISLSLGKRVIQGPQWHLILYVSKVVSHTHTQHAHSWRMRNVIHKFEGLKLKYCQSIIEMPCRNIFGQGMLEYVSRVSTSSLPDTSLVIELSIELTA